MIDFGPINTAPAPAPLGTIFVTGDSNTNNIVAGFVGQAATGATIGPTFAATGAQMAITAAFKSNTTTAASFIGVGPESYNSGSAASVSPVPPTNLTSGDVELAEIVEGTNTGIAITPKVVGVNYRASSGTEQTTASTSANFTIPTADKTNDLLTMFIRIPGGKTLTVIPTGWSLFTSSINAGTPGSGYLYYATAGASGNNKPGDVINWQCSSGGDFRFGFAGWYSVSGAATSIDVGSITTAAVAGNANSPVITTTANNEKIEAFADIDIGVGTTPGAGLTSIFTGGGFGGGYATQASSGASAQYNFSGGGTGAWLVGAIGIKATAGAAWTHVGSAVDASGVTQIDLYSRTATATEPASWEFDFGSNPGKSNGVIYDFSNLDTTTPVDAFGTAALAGFDNPMFPLVTPTNADELLFKCSSLLQGYQGTGTLYPTTPIFHGGSSLVGCGYSSLSGAAAQVASGNGNTGAFASFNAGLKAATTPTRSSNVAQVNQVGMLIISTALPAAGGAAASVFEEVISSR